MLAAAADPITGSVPVGWARQLSHNQSLAVRSGRSLSRLHNDEGPESKTTSLPARDKGLWEICSRVQPGPSGELAWLGPLREKPLRQTCGGLGVASQNGLPHVTGGTSLLARAC